MLAAGIGGGWGLLCLQKVLEVIEACCTCNMYWGGLGPAVLATGIGVG